VEELEKLIELYQYDIRVWIGLGLLVILSIAFVAYKVVDERDNMVYELLHGAHHGAYDGLLMTKKGLGKVVSKKHVEGSLYRYKVRLLKKQPG
jgi:hypothetical protein